jgi:hypothetical protein
MAVEQTPTEKRLRKALLETAEAIERLRDAPIPRLSPAAMGHLTLIAKAAREKAAR